MILERLNEVAKFISIELKQELEAQGHNASGELGKSIDVATKELVNGFVIQGSFVFYGKFVDTGRKAGGKKVPIDALIEWIRVKRIDLRGKKERSVAFAIQNSIHKKGIPTDGDQRKKRWISGTLERIEGDIASMIQTIVEDFVTLEFNNIIEKTRKEFTQIVAA